MAEKFQSFYIDHVPQQQNAHSNVLAALAALLALPAGIIKKVLVHIRDLYYQNLPLKIVELQEETFKLKKFLRL